MTATLFVRHKISDYHKWKRGYDEFAPFRNKSNITGASVHRDTRDTTIIIVTHQFSNVDSLMAFANSAELKAAMAGAGVIGVPEIWFGEEIENTGY
jgi:antibiotic biosynthesis monooxygenase (ABM) superfamily enzyme